MSSTSGHKSHFSLAEDAFDHGRVRLPEDDDDGLMMRHYRSLAFLALIFGLSAVFPSDFLMAQTDEPFGHIEDDGSAAPASELSTLTNEALIERIRLSRDPAALAELERRADRGDAWGMVGLAEGLLVMPAELSRGARVEDLLRQAIEQGNSFALVRLGDLYREGSVVARDPVRAVELYSLAVDQGSTAGQQRFGEALLAGEGVARDREAGLALLRQAATDGDPWRQIALANGILAESNDDADRSEAQALLEDAAGAGNPYAQIRLAELLTKDADGPADAERIVMLLAAAADQNLMPALLRLGQAYLDGSIVPMDPAKGLELLQRAAAAEDPEALIALGEAYAAERAIPADGDAAIAAFEKAAERGSAYGFVRLGELRRDGQLVEPDINRAVADFENAARAGEAWINVEIAGIYRDGRTGSVDIDRAVAAYETAISEDVPGAEIAYARDLARGLLGPDRREEGVLRLRQAVDDKARGAVAVVSDTLMWGWGVRQDQRRARDLLERAAADGDVEATRNLIALHRDGRYPTYRRSPSRAEALLDDIAGSLPKQEYEIEALLLKASRMTGPDEFALLLADLQAMARSDRRNAFTTLRWVNENAYVYMLQDALRFRGHFDASPTGRLDRRTINAFNAACRDLNQSVLCSHGPLTDVSVRIAASLVRGQ